jgi:hypothetical protein
VDYNVSTSILREGDAVAVAHTGWAEGVACLIL